jgi:hypothetical protein
MDRQSKLDSSAISKSKSTPLEIIKAAKRRLKTIAEIEIHGAGRRTGAVR